jgi:hypothetical protein
VSVLVNGVAARAAAAIATRKQASSSFFKKRTKKPLSVTGCTGVALLNRLLDAISKSFLLLFFKKEVLALKTHS